MTSLTIQYEGGGASHSDPEFVKCLFNVGKVAVDGDVYEGVTSATLTDHAVDLAEPETTSRDGVAFAEDDGTFVAIYSGHSGKTYAGIGDDRAAALHSLADNLDPFADVQGEFTRACIDGVEAAAEDAREKLRRDLREDAPR